MTSDSTFKDIRSKLKSNSDSLHLVFFKSIDILFVFLIVKIFGRLAYSPEYLKGKWFEKIWSPGWRWAFNGMFSKLFTAHGRGIPWPISRDCRTSLNVDFHVDELNLFQGNVYYQTYGDARITLGKNVWIAQGCALITSNHDLMDPSLHLDPKSIQFGDSCWLGSNVVITPGVTLGDHTVVGANSVVTKSFPDGYCVLGGVPAKVIKNLH